MVSYVIVVLALICQTYAKPADDATSAAKAADTTSVAVAENRQDDEKKVCPEGWMSLVDTCGTDTEPTACVKLGPPLQFVSWFHLQYICDKYEGGYLPEPTDTNKKQFQLILESYKLLYGDTLMYLGATDVTHQNNWKWFNRNTDVDDTKWTLPAKNGNDDCMAQSTKTGALANVDCEDDSIDMKLANVCMRAPEAPEAQGRAAAAAATKPEDRAYDGFSNARTEEEFYRARAQEKEEKDRGIGL